MRISMFLFVFLLPFSVFATEDLKTEFANPGVENRPWVYWFWNNGNLTAEGIKADLEAMAEVGIGGVLIMEVGQGAPVGPVDFLSDQWRELFKSMITEADRLGIEVNMNNDAGWNGSGGKWITPEYGMQILTWSETNLSEPKPEKITLPAPPKRNNYYKDIAVFAFPTPNDNAEKKSVSPDANRRATPNETAVVAQKDVIDLTGKMAEDGSLDWNVPAGNWTVLRLGHTSKGKVVAPAPTNGTGLECDKLSVKASEEAFNGQMGKLIADNRNLTGVGKTLMATHIDSWENGSQNWTPKMREEFQQRRQYDLWKFLPVFAGYLIDSTEITDRFFWDFRRTVSEMCMDNHIGTFQRLAHQHGIKLSAEAYDQAPCDFLQYGGMTDEPMGEFWCGGGWTSEGGRLNDCRGMASAGHLYGRKIIGAEAFTATNAERWLRHPGNLKALGDRAFCEGINRFVFHRYSFQPWRDVKPGLMMGPWGVHYERTQTWWHLTPAWHDYLSRCQFMLRQGDFAADIAYLEAEDSPQHYSERPRNGYQWDQCGAHAVFQMTVKNGKLTLPSGADYEILVLPQVNRMTPELLKKIAELVKNGATVIGNRPNEALGLTRYPQNDQQVRELAAELWGDNNEAVGERSFGNGKIVWGKSPETVLAEKGIRPAFSTDSPLNQIHRRTDSEEIYFVANPTDSSVLARAVFRAAGRPELWNPVTGKITSTAAFYPTDGGTAVMLPLQATESVFVVFRKETAPKTDAIVTVSHNGTVLGNLKEPAAGQWPEIKIVRAKYGPPGDTGRTIDVQEKLQKLVDSGVHRFPAAEMAKPVDPAYKVLKTLDLEWEIDGKTYTWKGDDNAIVDFLQMRNTSVAAEPSVNAAGQPCLNVRASGHYDVTLASGKPWSADVVLPEPLEITGSWQVEFPKKTVTFDKLFPWSDSDDETIQYFSGTGVYRKTFRIPDGYARSGQRIFLDPGQVETIAELKLNGQDFGTLWMSSKVTDVTEALNFTGENQLEIRVTNLWPNRLIGDASLPQEKERQPNGTLSAWPEWLLKGEPIPDGRETFCMWNLWTKDDALLPSGLLGPVRLVPVERCDVVGK